VDPLTQATIAILERNSALALSLEEVRDLLQRDRPGPEIPTERLMAELSGSKDAVHLVPHPKRRWAHAIGPRAWILVPRGFREPGGRAGILNQLRSSLAALGATVEPGSTRAWARWTRMLEEERHLRRALRKRGKTPEMDGPAPAD
jgi:hypothetical protein